MSTSAFSPSDEICLAALAALASVSKLPPSFLTMSERTLRLSPSELMLSAASKR